MHRTLPEEGLGKGAHDLAAGQADIAQHPVVELGEIADFPAVTPETGHVADNCDGNQSGTPKRGLKDAGRRMWATRIIASSSIFEQRNQGIFPLRTEITWPYHHLKRLFEIGIIQELMMRFQAMHLLDIDQFRTFVAIADTGSFTRAAEVVHKTQSAVSMQMKRLEERVGKRDLRARRAALEAHRRG